MNPAVKMIVDMAYLGMEKVLGRYYSKYRAFVVENEDPEGYGRLQLMIPGVNTNANEYWAWGVNQFNGPGFGGHVIPPKGTMVWVEFEMGDPGKPLWSHGSFGKPSAIPKEDQSPNIFWFKTPKGISVHLNDDTGEIIIKDKDAQIIKFSEDGIFIQSERKIHLTGDNLEPEEFAALGKEVEKQLKGMNDGLLKGLGSMTKGLSAMADFAKDIALSTTPAGLVTNIALKSTGLITNINSAVSENEANDKSIKELSNKLPDIKSKRVLIDK